MTKTDLIAFEAEVAARFERGEIRGPVHLSGGNEEQLIEIFKDVPKDAWVFSTWRNHYHALLHGIPREKVMAQIMAGHSMNLSFPEYRFFTSAIVGGILPIAVGVASVSEHPVWCFVGDMTALSGAFAESERYAQRNQLPITFVIEDNGVSTNSPTAACWGELNSYNTRHYIYRRTTKHVGTGTFVQF